jgi:acyl-CoA synthetase (NDP forming)
VPILRGAAEAFTAIAAVARWEARQERRLERGPVREGWPALASDRTPLGHDPAVPGLLDADADVAAGAVTLSAGRALPELASLARLDAAGIPVVSPDPAADADEAVARARTIGFPVVLKLDAIGLAHKSDIGGVRIGIADEAGLRSAAAELLAISLPDGAARRGLLVSRQLDGIELILGGRRDPSFGPLVVVGLGGILAEVLDDVAVRLAPVDEDDAAAMLDELHGAAVLAGVRGRPGIDRPAVIDGIVRLGRLLAADPTIVEIDANPVISGPGGTAAVDALVVVEEP